MTVQHVRLQETPGYQAKPVTMEELIAENTKLRRAIEAMQAPQARATQGGEIPLREQAPAWNREAAQAQLDQARADLIAELRALGLSEQGAEAAVGPRAGVVPPQREVPAWEQQARREVATKDAAVLAEAHQGLIAELVASGMSQASAEKVVRGH
jgi:hypothetical protein